MKNLERDLAWLKAVLDYRLQWAVNRYSQEQTVTLAQLPPPSIVDEWDSYGQFIIKHNISIAERLLLILSIIPHAEPFYLTEALAHLKAATNDLETKVLFVRYDTPKFLEFALFRDPNLGYYLPTGNTFLYLLFGQDIKSRLAYSHLLKNSHPFYQQKILHKQALKGAAVFGSELLLADISFYESLLNNK